MSNEPIIAAVVLPDGRRWQHVGSPRERFALAEELALPIEQAGTFLLFDPHETAGYLALRGPDGRTQFVARIEVGELHDVQAHYGRPGTEEEWRLACEVPAAFGQEILRQAGYATEDDPNGGPGP